MTTLHDIDRRVTTIEGSLEKRSEILRSVVTTAVQEAMPAALLTDEQHRWVQLAIQKEAQSIAFRKAVIEKTIIGLIWAAVIGIGYVLRDFAIAHGWKP